MAFAPPRKPPGGSRLPVVTKTSSIIRRTPSESTSTTITTTSVGRSTASTTKPSSCSATCSSGGTAGSRSGTRGETSAARPTGARARGPPVGQRVVEKTSSVIMEPGRRTTTTTERRTTVPTRSSGYGVQRPATAPTPQSVCPGVAAAQRRLASAGRSSGYGMPRRAPAPGGRPSAPRGQIETVTSVSSMSRDTEGTETFVEQEQRVIQPAPPRPTGARSGRAAPPSPCPAAASRVPTAAMRVPPTALRGSAAGPAAGRPVPSRSTGRSAVPATASMQRVTTRSSKSLLSDGTEIRETSSRTETKPIPRSSGYGPPRRPVASTASAASISTTTSTGAIPKVKTVTSRTSRTSVRGTKKTTTTQEVTKLIPESLPEGRYAMPLKHAPHTKEGRYSKFSSPPGIRRKMDAEMPKGIKSSLMPPEFRGIQDIKRLTALKPYKDTVSCAMDIRRGRGSAASGFEEPFDASLLERNIEQEYGSPYASPTGKSPLGEPSPRTILEREVEQRLMQAAALSPGKALRASGTRKSPARPHVIITDQGPVVATEQVITEKKVEKSPGSEKISRHITGIEKMVCGALQVELDTQTLEPGGLPEKGDMALETVSVRSAVAIAPGGIKETTTTVIYETTGKKSPEKRITMSPEEVERLIEEEAIDVSKTMKLKPLDLKVISPKTYMIRKREHELKLNYASILELQQSIIIPEPSPDQEQEEVQPEMVATIMYTEETRLGLESQPAQMYEVLFPQVHEATMMTVNSAVPPPLQDVLVPAQLPENFHVQGSTVDVEAAVSTVETKGEQKPSGNAFSESNKAKPAVKNVAKRGRKKKITDIPLLAQEMPPWAVEDMEPIMDIVGVPLKTSLVVESIDEKEEGEAKEPEEEDIIPLDFMMQLEPPTHISRIQLRGSTRPPWFQGYYLALPEIPDLVKVGKTAEHALASAWRSVQPNLFPEDSIITV